MDVSLTNAKAQLTELVRFAERGDDVILTRRGEAVAKIVPVKPRLDRARRRAILEQISREAAAEALPGPCAARSQDFLYDEDGLPA